MGTAGNDVGSIRSSMCLPLFFFIIKQYEFGSESLLWQTNPWDATGHRNLPAIPGAASMMVKYRAFVREKVLVKLEASFQSSVMYRMSLTIGMGLFSFGSN